jgi:GNAT superfamily N-acetyltransferase
MTDQTQLIKETPKSLAIPADCGIYRSTVEFILELRQKVLRPGLRLETARFEGDDLITTYHFLLAYPTPLEKGDPVCCATFMRTRHRGEIAHQLRGMATDPGHQKKGFGKILLCATEEILVERTGIRLLWCNARESAVSFYKDACGWSFDKCPPFDIPGIGMHRVMFKRV